jgi:hypothetical protein
MTEIRQNRRIVQEDNKPKDKNYGIFKVEDGDIHIISGPYAGYWVKAMWCQGPDERDYIFKHIYKRGDEVVVNIIKELFCK